MVLAVLHGVSEGVTGEHLPHVFPGEQFENRFCLEAAQEYVQEAHDTWKQHFSWPVPPQA